MIARRSALLLALAAVAPAVALILPDTCKEDPYVPNKGGVITFWDTTNLQWPGTLSATPPFVYVPDECGNGGSIGVRYIYGGAYPMPDWDTAPNGACPDGRTTRLLGTNEQTPFSSSNGDVCAIRSYSDGDEDEESYIIEVDFSKYDCTPLGAPSAGASYAGTMIGFSDFYSGENGGTVTQYQFTGTTVGGGNAGDFKSWALYNADGESGATELQTWNAGTTSGILTGSDLAAPPGSWGNSGDVTFALMTMSPNERYSKLRVQVTTTRGSGDFAGFVMGSVKLEPCPPGWSYNEATQRCEPCPAGTYYNADAKTCIPCAKGLNTFGCAATTAQQCHKPCMAGQYWDAEDMACKRCPPYTYWPVTNGLETDKCIPCAAPRRELAAFSTTHATGSHNKTRSASTKYGAKSCPAYPNKPVKKPIGA